MSFQFAALFERLCQNIQRPKPNGNGIKCIAKASPLVGTAQRFFVTAERIDALMGGGMAGEETFSALMSAYWREKADSCGHSSGGRREETALVFDCLAFFHTHFQVKYVAPLNQYTVRKRLPYTPLPDELLFIVYRNKLELMHIVPLEQEFPELFETPREPPPEEFVCEPEYAVKCEAELSGMAVADLASAFTHLHLVTAD